MAWLRSIHLRLRALFRNGRHQSDLDEEMQAHLDQLISDFKEEGLTEEQAEKRALKEFGNIESLKEEARDSWGMRVVMDLISDIRYSSRLLWQSKGFSVAVLLTLGLCIGGNTIVFSILNTALGPPAYPEPDRVVEIYNNYPGKGIGRSSSNIPLYLDFRDNADAFERLTLVDEISANITSGSAISRGVGLLVTADYFNVFKFDPLVGQLFGEEHFIEGSGDVIVLTESHWRTHYASEAKVVGKTITVDSELLTIIGVAPEAASWQNRELDFFRAWTWSAERVQFETTVYYGRNNNYANLWARLKPGASILDAKAQVDALDRRFAETASERITDWMRTHQHESKIETFQQSRLDELGRPLSLLRGGLLLVLLIGCVNVINLQLNRGLNRLPEFAMREALGASKFALVRRLVVECFALVLCGCLAGMFFAWGGIFWVNQIFLKDMLPAVDWVSIDSSAVGSALALSAVVGVVIGLFSAAAICRENLNAAIREYGGKTTASKWMQTLKSGLVSGQLAMTLVLLIAAGLLLQSFNKALNGDSGFDAQEVVTASIKLPDTSYGDTESVIDLYTRLEESIKGMPGVESFALVAYLPALSLHGDGPVRVPDYEAVHGEDLSNVNYNMVSIDYFKTMGIPLLSGSGFSFADAGGDTRNVIVDQEFAERYFEGDSPIGRKIVANSSRMLPVEKWSTIVGVVENVKHKGLDSVGGNPDTRDGRMPLVYLPLNPRSFSREFSVLVKSERSHQELVPLVRESVQAIDLHLPIFLSGSLDKLIRGTLDDRQAFMLLIVVLGGIALLLSLVGIYGVLSFDVSQRTREIGIRIAMGAPKSVILRNVLNQGLFRAGVGLLVGLVVTRVLSSRLAGLLYEVSPYEPGAYLVVMLLLLIISLAASYFPAKRATRIHPIEALRVD